MTISEESPIFIRGLSRSGGTLLVTIWDAHPDISMSYELYPNLLYSLLGDKEKIVFFHELLGNEKLIKKKFTGDHQQLKTFVARCYRSGLSSMDLLNVYQKFSDKVGGTFSTEQDCMEFIACCAREKMEKEGKSIWGMKCSGAFSKYLEIWPKANFINIVRDGRDVLSSQLLTGAFNKTVSEVAAGYKANHDKFANFLDLDSFRGMNVLYENLVNDSEKVIRQMCELVGLNFSPDMLSHSEKDLTIFKNSVGHLSRDRISKPIDNSQIGRWRHDLDPSQVEEFEKVAGDVLKRFDYL
jgi:hypothetical protein